MSIKRILFTITVAVCVALLGLGIYMATYPSDYEDTDFSLLAIGIVLTVLSAMIWSHIFGKKSSRVKTINRRLTYGMLALCIAASWVWSFFVHQLDCGLFTVGGCKNGIFSEELALYNSFFWEFFLFVPLLFGGILAATIRKNRRKRL